MLPLTRSGKNLVVEVSVMFSTGDAAVVEHGHRPLSLIGVEVLKFLSDLGRKSVL